MFSKNNNIILVMITEMVTFIAKAFFSLTLASWVTVKNTVNAKKVP